MAHEDEYHDALLDACQLVWGEGFLAPGGAGSVAKMVSGLDVADRLIVDIGSGLGGPACVLGKDFGARVLGLDLEQGLVGRSRARAHGLGLSDRVRFEVVDGGPLAIPDDSVDVVMSAGAFTQTSDKLGAFRECLRVLRPGGAITLYDWFRRDAELSPDMLYWIELEGITYALESTRSYAEILESAGFEDVHVEDASDWYRRAMVEEYEALRGRQFPGMVEGMGREQAEHFVENWRAMKVVCEKGEMVQAYTRARKPGG
jgi:phosphoethanolamine N-methyltransferase